MKLSKILFASIFLFCTTSCSFWQTAKNTNSSDLKISDEAKSDIPFESKEPDIFQTEIVITNFSNDEKTEKVYFIARSGNKTLTVFNRGAKTENSVLNDGAKRYFINGETKTFRENQTVSGGNSTSDETLEFLTTEWLNRKTAASFEKLETENNLTNYRVRLNDAAASEIILTFDETIKLPVKQEFYRILNEAKILTMTIEMKNFQTSADENIFVLPQDYKRTETK